MLTYNIKNWTTFFATFKRIKYESVSNLGSTFKGDLDRSIKANQKHTFKIDVISQSNFSFHYQYKKR